MGLLAGIGDFVAFGDGGFEEVGIDFGVGLGVVEFVTEF